MLVTLFTKQVLATKESYISPYGMDFQVYEIWDSKDKKTQKYKQLEVMREAGVDWYRSDYPWSWLEENSAEDFENTKHTFHALFNAFAPYNQHFVPLVIGMPNWANNLSPSEQKKAWQNFIKKSVKEFPGIEYWEINSEQDLHGLAAERYAPGLNSAYDAYKEANKTTKILYGSLLADSYKYFDRTMELGSKDKYDIMNIHCYRKPLMSFFAVDNYIKNIKKWVNDIKDKYGRDVPIWSTEMGYASPKLAWHDYLRWEISVVYKELFDNKKQHLSYLYDTRIHGIEENHIPSEIITKTLESILNQEVENIRVDQFVNLSVEDHPIVIMPVGEIFPGDVREELVDYVRRGGTVIFNDGMPATFDINTTSDPPMCVWRDTQGYLESKLHFRSLADWFKVPNDVPGALKTVPAEKYKDTFPNAPGNYGVGQWRYFDDGKIKQGDTYIPFAWGNSPASIGKYAAGAIYKLGSDGMKGNVVCSAVFFDLRSKTTERDQAAMIPQVHLASFYAGIGKQFWYEFRDDNTEGDSGYDPETSFGMVHKNLTKKLGFYSYKAMVKARPPGSVQDCEYPYHQDDYAAFHWKRGDGKDGWAFWTYYDIPFYLNIPKGKIDEAFGMYGDSVQLKCGDKVVLTNDVLYIIGPEEISFSRTPVQCPEEDESNLGLILGISIPCSLIFIAAIVIAVICIIKRNKSTSSAEYSNEI